MERMNRHAAEDAEEFNSPDDFMLPPRKAVHPSDKQKVIKVFYRTLVVLFILLTAGLLVWGVQSK
jgi:hypothetical protein